MSEDVLWSLEADPESVLAALDEVSAGAAAMGDEMDSVLAEMDGAFASVTTAVEEMSAATVEGFSSMEEQIATLDQAMAEIHAMSQALIEAALNTAETTDAETSSFGTLGDALTADSEAMTGLQGVMDSLNATVAEDTTLISSLNETITNLQAQVSALTAEESSAAESTTALGEAEVAAAEESQTLGDALQSAMGPLMMIAGAAAMVGAKFVSMGLAGQKGEALLSGMAGASSQDIQALQGEALKLGLSMDAASAGFYQVESAGYSGSQAITVFDAATRLAEGGQMQASDAMSALTAIMHDYSAKASDATHYTDLMAEAVVRGKQSAGDFSRSIGPLASAGENVGLSFQQVAAAEATMTQINPSVQRDSMQLTGLFQSLDPAIGGVAKKAAGLKISFDEAHYSSLDLLGKLQYLAEITGGTNTAAFVKLTGGVRGSTAAIDLLKGGAASFKGNLEAMQHATGATANAFASWEDTIPAHLDKVGAAFSVFATKFMDAIGPHVIPIIDAVSSAVSGMADMIMNHTSQVLPILVGLAGVIAGAVVAALVALVISIGPVLLALAAFGVAVAGVTMLVQSHMDMISTAFGKMSRDAEMHTLQLKLQSNQHTLEAAQGNVENIEWQKEQIERKITETKDAHTKAMLEMKLKALEHSQQQAQGVVQNIERERQGIQAQMELLNPVAHLKSLQRKDDTIANQIEETQRTVAGYGQMRAGIEQQLSQTTNAVKRHALEAQLAQITAAQKQKEGVLKQMEGQRQGIEKQMTAIHQQMSAEQNNPLLRLISAFQQAGAAIQNGFGAALRTVMPFVQMLGSYIASQFMPVWQQLVSLWQTQLAPLFAQLGQALQQAMPLLQLLGAIVGGVLVVGLGLMVGAITAVIKGLAGFLSGLMIVIAGVVRTLTGVFQVIGGVVSFFIDLFTGHFSKLGADLGQIWQGIVNMFLGVFQIIGGLFATLWYTVSGIVTGFVDGIIGFFTHLWDELVGHSIIPDMVRGILSWFTNLGSEGLSLINHLISNIENVMGSLGSKALGWATDMMHGFINGITNMVGNLGNTVSNVAGTVAKFLHFSKPDEGPLADADTYMPDMVEMMAQGLQNNRGKLKQAVSDVAGTLQGAMSPSLSLQSGGGLSLPGSTALGGGNASSLLSQILATLQQHGLGGGTSSTVINQTNHNSLSGINNIQDLYNLFNLLAGQQNEAGARGAY